MSKVSVVGLGYVGLPLAAAFGKKGHEVIGFDVQEKKLEQLREFEDATGEVNSADLKAAGIQYTSDPALVQGSEFIVVAVPTPIDQARQPDLTPLDKASQAIAPYLSNRVVVIYESTVYPGVTEEYCLPVLESAGKVRGEDFRLGYSPERINPGDKEHTIDKIIKVVSAEDEQTLDEVAKLYESVVTVGVHRAESIMVAEAAKVIENTQRDLNIALMNELSIIFDKMGIRTRDVLRAAGTKWNFLNFYPGLVGGHCIGVDPYYLTHRAEALGYIPQVITAGRRINDGMGKRVAEKTVKFLINAGSKVKGAKVLVLGMTFKENVPDFRNSKVVDVVKELKEYQANVLTHDVHCPEGEMFRDADSPCVNLEEVKGVDAVILAVGHDEYRKMSVQRIKELYSEIEQPIFIDVQSVFAEAQLEKEGFVYWQL
ncbi:MAG: nucleotide sugar dehydrogenase [Planctomycetes bacterium]|nr:nucleotide sugar dehydrogenase [Planctomycetota bacterium]